MTRRRRGSPKPIFRGLDFEGKSCTRKVRFANEREALERAGYLAVAHPTELGKCAYACEFCGGWHLATRRAD